MNSTKTLAIVAVWTAALVVGATLALLQHLSICKEWMVTMVINLPNRRTIKKHHKVDLIIHLRKRMQILSALIQLTGAPAKKSISGGKIYT